LKSSLVLWLIGDGKPGHENQSLGLADALARRLPCEVRRISLAGVSGLIKRVKTASAASQDFPDKPDFIIAAGHATHLALWSLARKHRATSIVLMRPSLPLACFDFCIAPAHDFPDPPQRQNLILTRGALHRVAPVSGEKAGRMILVGGPSKTHAWDGAALLAALTEITAIGSWQLTDSRRTPAGFLDQIRQSLPAIEIFPHTATPPKWLPGKLATADEVWVTEDSVSMIYEALSSGAKVGLLPVPRLTATSRVLRGLEQLIADGFLTPFADWQKARQLKPPPSILREADRCADEVIRNLSL
jgi:mitochondrial fission protein ELM1